MYKTINKHQFVQGFDDMNRGDNFTREGRRRLYDYYTQLEDGIGEKIEYDPIAICCEWGEYHTLHDAIEDYQAHDMQELESQTDIIELSGDGVLVRVF